MVKPVQTSGRATLRPMRPDERPALDAAAAADGHVTVAPTHVVEKAGEIVGYASLGAVVVLNTWVCRSKVSARESFTLLREGEAVLASAGVAEFVCLPVAQDSPFLPLVQKMGYTPLGWSSYNLKSLTK